LLHSSFSYDYLRRQKISIVSRLLDHARNAEIENRAWERWLVLYHVSQLAKSSNLLPFEAYMEKIKRSSQQAITEDEYEAIIHKAEETKAMHQQMLKR
jgi:hypothetical protein